MSTSRLHRLARRVRRLAADRSGLALLEFGYTLPLVVAVGCYGVEVANVALINLRVSQVALNLADNASRVGAMNALSVEQLREVDINDILTASKMQGTTWNLTSRGRITLSSLEANASGTQTIHWQRCLGAMSGTNYDSSYGRTTIVGTTPANADNASAAYDPNAGINTSTNGTDNSATHPGSVSTNGMGDSPDQVKAPASSGVMFVEINYQYQPIFSSKWLPSATTRIHYIASFIVRDRRDFTELYDPSPAVAGARLTCDKHTS